MIQETLLTRCGHCGAPLSPSADRVVFTCAYCGTRTYLGASPDRSYRGPADDHPAHAEPRAPIEPGAPLGLHASLLRGPLGRPVGAAQRLDPAALHQQDATRQARALWPHHAEASSTYGRGWAPAAMLGPPRVFPRSGDIAGAWAPGPQHSPVEWVELEFAADGPVHAVRVYETHQAGSVFAVVDATTDDETLLYADDPVVRAGAWALEVTVSPPRPLRRLRVYVANNGWTELDTVALLLPAATALGPTAPASRGLGRFALGALGVLAGFVALVVWGASRSSTPVTVDHIPRPALTVPGASMQYHAASLDDLTARGVIWAHAVTSFSSEYSPSRNAARAAAGPPDVYPRTGDLSGAWAPRTTDDGPESITLAFAAPVLARSLVWAETLHPGAVVRVEDVSDPARPVTLWDGSAGPAPSSAAMAEVTLAAPRSIAALRLSLDTRLVSGWNEIDAVGLIPARP